MLKSIRRSQNFKGKLGTKQVNHCVENCLRNIRVELGRVRNSYTRDENSWVFKYKNILNLFYIGCIWVLYANCMLWILYIFGLKQLTKVPKIVNYSSPTITDHIPASFSSKKSVLETYLQSKEVRINKQHPIYWKMIQRRLKKKP